MEKELILNHGKSIKEGNNHVIAHRETDTAIDK